MKNLLLALLLTGPAALAQTATRPAPAALPTAAPATEGVSAAGLQRIDSLLQAYVADARVPGAIGLLVRDGKVVYRKAFGYADVAARTPLAPDAIMRIASQTKAVTSVGLMLLYDEGKFQLDDPVSRYLPAFAHPRVLASFNPADSSYTTVPARSEITIRQLLTHTSGIDYAVIGSPAARAIYAKAHVASGVGDPEGTLAAGMERLAGLPLLHQPGERFTYGLSVDVVGRLVEVLSGQPLDAFLRRRLFEPLGMRDTYFYLPPARQLRLVPLYTESASHQTVPMPTRVGGLRPDYPKQAGTYFSGGAGLSSTIDDYAQFLQMLLSGGSYQGRRLLKPATVQLMTTNQIGDVMQGRNKFGLGFGLVTPDGAAHGPLPAGAYEWGGIFGTTYWVDPTRHLVGLLYTQKYPAGTGADLGERYKRLVYRALVK